MPFESDLPNFFSFVSRWRAKPACCCGPCALRSELEPSSQCACRSNPKEGQELFSTRRPRLRSAPPSCVFAAMFPAAALRRLRRSGPARRERRTLGKGGVGIPFGRTDPEGSFGMRVLVLVHFRFAHTCLFCFAFFVSLSFASFPLAMFGIAPLISCLALSLR